jgi:hypothetical protein
VHKDVPAGRAGDSQDLKVYGARSEAASDLFEADEHLGAFRWFVLCGSRAEDIVRTGQVHGPGKENCGTADVFLHPARRGLGRPVLGLPGSGEDSPKKNESGQADG